MNELFSETEKADTSHDSDIIVGHFFKTKMIENRPSKEKTKNSAMGLKSSTLFGLQSTGNHKSAIHKTDSASSTDSTNDCSPYKSPSVLSFDAYGNLTSSDDPSAPYSHEVPSLEEFDYILNSFEGKLNDSSESELVTSPTFKTKNIVIKKKGPNKNKHKSGSGECPQITDKALKKAFKEDLNSSSASITSRYGRTRKHKSQDGFLFGTLNFNELRKITSTSPKKSRHLSSCEAKSDSENFDLPVENLKSNLCQNFGMLSEKFAGYSSEDEFILETKISRNARRKTLPSNFDKRKEKMMIKNQQKEPKVKLNVKTERNKNSCKRSTRKRGDLEETKPVPVEPEKDPKSNTKERVKYIMEENVLDSNIIGKNIVEKKFTYHEPFNMNANENKAINKEELGDILDDVNIIKSSLGLATLKPIEPGIEKVLQNSHTLIDESDDVKIMYDSQGGQTNELPFDDSLIKSECEVIKMETLTDEVKTEEPTTTKYGRQVRKPNLIDLSVKEEKRKKEAIEKHKHSEGEIECQKRYDTTNAHQHAPLDPEQQQLEKDYPCLHFVGDLVWVTMKTHPAWPAMVTYSKNETLFTRVTKSPQSKMKCRRQYHVKFFFDNHRTMWVNNNSLLIYEGLPKLLSYIEKLKLTDGKNYMKGLGGKCVLFKALLKVEFHLKQDRHTHSKTFQWYKAIEEVDDAASLDRHERLRKYTLRDKKKREKDPTYSPEPKKKRKFSKSENSVKHNPYERPESRPPSVGKRPENGSSKSKSSDDFSGFDEDSSFESHKAKRLKLDEKVKNGDFEVFLQKRLDSTMDELNLKKDAAETYLLKKWRRLSQSQKTRYKSKLSSFERAESTEGDDSSSDLSSVASVSVSSSRPKRCSLPDDEEGSKGMYRIPRNDKVCVSCESIAQKSMDVIKCKGPCASIFHLQCVGLDVPPEGDFKCPECLSGRHTCFICKSNEGDTIKCSVPSCGKFYHKPCSKAYPQVAHGSKKFVCPRHVCHMCAANADDMNDPAARTPPFTRCIRCPTSYHTGETCIAAGVEEISQTIHICTKHMKLPKNNLHHFNVNWCFCCSKGGSLLLCDQCPAAFHAECMNITAPEGSYICEDCENGKFPVYGDIVWVKLGTYRWWPGEVLHPRYIPDNIEKLSHAQGMFCVHFFGSDDYYWLSRGRTFHYQEGDQGSKNSSSKTREQQFQKALDEAVVAYRKQKEKRDKQEQSRSLKGNLKPPPYVRIDTNKPVGNVRLGKLDPSTVTRCDCDPYSENPCGSDDKCINRMLMVECIREICAGKDRCNNQRFQKRLYPNVCPFKTTGRGWGLKTKEFIRKGRFVIEYVGELIDDAEFRKRIEEMHDSKEENYYFLTVETDRLVDAGPKGNLARFMNHSCQPNCETQKWTVGADTRVGLFALQDIPEGSELTFNYNLECVGTDKKKCNCGADICSGFIGVKVQKTDPGHFKKPKLENGVKKKKKNRKRKITKNTENECFRCGNAGDLILCDYATCPKGYHLQCLGLKEVPKGKWLCPWHHCDECGIWSSNRCIMCPNSFCKSHTTDKFHTMPGLESICMDHGAEDMEALRGQMKVDPNHCPAENRVQKCPPETAKGVTPPVTAVIAPTVEKDDSKKENKFPTLSLTERRERLSLPNKAPHPSSPSQLIDAKTSCESHCRETPQGGRRVLRPHNNNSTLSKNLQNGTEIATNESKTANQLAHSADVLPKMTRTKRHLSL